MLIRPILVRAQYIDHYVPPKGTNTIHYIFQKPVLGDIL